MLGEEAGELAPRVAGRFGVVRLALFAEEAVDGARVDLGLEGLAESLQRLRRLLNGGGWNERIFPAPEEVE